MRKSKLAMLVTALAITLSSAMPVFADTGWVNDSGVWSYYHTDGTQGKNQWIKEGDSLFWLEEDGTMAVSKWHQEGETWYWLDGSGCAATGWVEIDGKWYFFHDNYQMAEEEYIGSRYVGKDGAWDTSK